MRRASINFPGPPVSFVCNNELHLLRRQQALLLLQLLFLFLTGRGLLSGAGVGWRRSRGAGTSNSLGLPVRPVALQQTQTRDIFFALVQIFDPHLIHRGNNEIEKSELCNRNVGFGAVHKRRHRQPVGFLLVTLPVELLDNAHSPVDVQLPSFAGMAHIRTLKGHFQNRKSALLLRRINGVVAEAVLEVADVGEVLRQIRGQN
mmetsp:Transcript_48773/g.95665  ORF Transcript_48773/g.95665 Transcript_48773/m.95665 type:complete len:203 (-) Transcript_48773:1389-1997(-)